MQLSESSPRPVAYIDGVSKETILLTTNRKIANVVVFGVGRPQNGLIVSPVSSTISSNAFFDEIWPTIELMNNIIPAHSRVVKELVLIEDEQLPFSLTDKGTVREKITVKMYEDQIENAYRNLEAVENDRVASLSGYGKEDITLFLKDVLQDLLPDGEFTDQADLFEYGEFEKCFNNELLLSHTRNGLTPCCPTQIDYRPAFAESTTRISTYHPKECCL